MLPLLSETQAVNVTTIIIILTMCCRHRHVVATSATYNTCKEFVCSIIIIQCVLYYYFRFWFFSNQHHYFDLKFFSYNYTTLFSYNLYSLCKFHPVLRCLLSSGPSIPTIELGITLSMLSFDSKKIGRASCRERV